MSFKKTFTKDITFSTNALGVHGTETLKFDFSQSNNPNKRPVLIIGHGGGFLMGDKAGGMKPIFDPLVTKLGVSVAYINYRLADVNQFTGKSEAESTKLMWEACFRAIEDAKSCARFILNGNYNADPNQIWIGGVSAGAVAAMQSIHWDKSEYDTVVDIAKWSNLDNGNTNIDFCGALAVSGAIFTKQDIDKTTKPIIHTYGLLDTTLKPNGGSNHRCPYIGALQVIAQSEVLGNPIYSLEQPFAGHCGKDPNGDPIETAMNMIEIKEFLYDNLKTLIH